LPPGRPRIAKKQKPQWNSRGLRRVGVFELHLPKGFPVTSIARRTTGAIILALSIIFAAPGMLRAQDQYDQAKLESFVTAALTVNQLVEQWTPRIRSAASETEAAELRDQANGELVAAIEETGGISVDEYREISQAAQNDPQLMARISGIFDQREPQ
jgi:Domain of unknown function (DUF4168)